MFRCRRGTHIFRNHERSNGSKLQGTPRDPIKMPLLGQPIKAFCYSNKTMITGWRKLIAKAPEFKTACFELFFLSLCVSHRYYRPRSARNLPLPPRCSAVRAGHVFSATKRNSSETARSEPQDTPRGPIKGTIAGSQSNHVVLRVMFKAVEDRPTPNEVYNWKVYLISLTAAFGSLMFGYDSGFIGGMIALPSFANEFLTGGVSGKHATQSANIVSFYQIGAIVGSILVYPITEKFGRRAGMIFAGGMNALGAVLQVVATRSLGLGIFYAGRVIGGVGVGAVSMCVPIYIAEIAPTAIRGRLVGLYELMYQTGALVGFWIPYAVNTSIPSDMAKQWRIPVGIQIIPAAIIFFGALFITESPRWLLKNEKTEKALTTLSFLRNLPEDHPYVQEEVAIIQAAIALERGMSHSRGRFSTLKEIALPGNRNRLVSAAILMWFQNLTGINAINYYSPTIFKALGIQGTSTGLFSTGIYGIVKTITTAIFCIYIIDRFPRRLILTVGAAGGCFAMFYIGGYVAIAKPDPTKHLGSGGISAIAMIYIFAIFYSASWNGTVWIYSAEVFPITIRSVCMAISAAMQWLAQFTIARSTPYMIASLGYGTYVFFGIWMVIMFFWVLFFLKETKGVSLEQMDELFGLAPAHRVSANINDKQTTEHIEIKSSSGASTPRDGDSDPEKGL
ncbi:hypothetical protein EW146_g2245 [Bondarzewia mesenterica]|uniref:Quinate transporter n=1 Tax=Bondarzewia mesenterica TaxID=1095465 RepID=A0A4S4M1I4_9AGAM|nr:hypothetical protein EW146_g2245 [Bondarzewia mesenterica]